MAYDPATGAIYEDAPPAPPPPIEFEPTVLRRTPPSAPRVGLYGERGLSTPVAPVAPALGPSLANPMENWRPTSLSSLAMPDVTGGVIPAAVPSQTPAAPAAPPFDPTRLMTTGSTSGGSTSITPGDPTLLRNLGAMDPVYAQQKAAIDASTKAQQAQAAQRSLEMSASGARMEFAQAKDAEARAKVMAKAEELDKEAGKIRDEIKATNIDPQRYWRESNPVAIIGIMLGAAASEFARVRMKIGGPNPVMQMVERAIDRDVDAQKADLAKKQGELGANRGLLADVYRRVGDLDQAATLHKQLLVEDLQRRLGVIAENAASPLLAANAQQQIAALEGQKVQLKIQALQVARDRVTKSFSGSTTKQMAGEVMAKMAPKPGPQLSPKEVLDIQHDNMLDFRRLEKRQKLRMLWKAGAAPGTTGSWGPRWTPKADEYMRARAGVIRDMLQAVGPKAMGNKNIAARFEAALPEKIEIGGETYESGLAKIDSGIAEVATRLRDSIQQLRDRGIAPATGLPGGSERGRPQ